MYMIVIVPEQYHASLAKPVRQLITVSPGMNSHLNHIDEYQHNLGNQLNPG